MTIQSNTNHIYINKSLNDKRSLVETRLERIKLIAVTQYASTYVHAMKGTIDKLKTPLDTTLCRSSNQYHQ